VNNTILFGKTPLKAQHDYNSDGVSRLGLGLETRLETRFLESRSRRSQVSVSKDFGLGLEPFVSRLCIGYFYELLQGVP